MVADNWNTQWFHESPTWSESQTNFEDLENNKHRHLLRDDALDGTECRHLSSISKSAKLGDLWMKNFHCTILETSKIWILTVWLDLIDPSLDILHTHILLSAIMLMGLWSCNFRVATVRGKSGKRKFFQGQGKVREFCKKSAKVSNFEKVRENQFWSGNFTNSTKNIDETKPLP